MDTENAFQTKIRWLQLRLNPAVPLSPSQIRVHVYRDKLEAGVLDTLNHCFQQQLPMPEHAPDSYMAFILCKPSLTDDTLDVHALECLGDDGEPNGELWLKLKSGAGLATAFGAPGSEQSIPLAALQQYLLGDVELPALAPLTQHDGPSWLCCPLSAAGDRWELPVLETPLDVPQRFAGHCYLKLVTVHHPAYRGLPQAIEEKTQ
ncbi:hypothetical protein ACNKU7_17720 [Microbulbifer sp. SA54]|uniref:hypothetical protein n=1 Tax=Microbulbifer sp. SA54 TaxID=3401577 RepID=UPI003AAB87F6